MMIDQNKIYWLRREFDHKYIPYPHGYDLLYIDNKNTFYRICKDAIYFENNAGDGDFSFIKRLVKRRGDILDVYTKIEYMITLIIKLDFAGINVEKQEKIYSVIREKTLGRKKKLINDLGYLKGIQNFNPLVKVRNDLAHKWGLHEVYYNNDSLSNHKNFLQFKKDLYFLFSSIVNELKKIQKKVDYDKLYLELDNYKKDYIKTKKKIGKYFEHYHNGVIKLKNKINC